MYEANKARYMQQYNRLLARRSMSSRSDRIAALKQLNTFPRRKPKVTPISALAALLDGPELTLEDCSDLQDVPTGHDSQNFCLNSC